MFLNALAAEFKVYGKTITSQLESAVKPAERQYYTAPWQQHYG